MLRFFYGPYIPFLSEFPFTGSQRRCSRAHPVLYARQLPDGLLQGLILFGKAEAQQPAVIPVAVKSRNRDGSYPVFPDQRSCKVRISCIAQVTVTGQQEVRAVRGQYFKARLFQPFSKQLMPGPEIIRQTQVHTGIRYIIPDSVLQGVVDSEYIELVHLADLLHQVSRGNAIPDLPAGSMKELAKGSRYNASLLQLLKPGHAVKRPGAYRNIPVHLIGNNE